MRHSRISQEEIREIIDYEPETGYFYKLVNGVRSGTYTLRKYKRRGDNLYLSLKCGDVLLLCARVAYLLMEGKWPESQLGYEDGDLKNLKWANICEIHRKRTREVKISKVTRSEIIESVSFCLYKNNHKDRYISHLKKIISCDKKLAKFSQMSIENIVYDIKDSIPLD